MGVRYQCFLHERVTGKMQEVTGLGVGPFEEATGIMEQLEEVRNSDSGHDPVFAFVFWGYDKGRSCVEVIFRVC